LTREEDWIYIIQPDGEKKIASPAFIKKLLGVDVEVFNLKRRARELELKVSRLESPGRQAQILELIAEHGPRSRPWINNRVSDYHYYDLDNLVAGGFLVESRSGTHRMYGLPEVIEN
jgi:hypothetical protein